MIKLCRNLFYKPKYGSDADSIMLKRLFSTVTIILVCLAAISFSAYAFFSYSVTSGANIIQASNFATSVTIKESDDSLTQGKIQNQTLQPGEYTVTITVDEGTTGTGYCIIRINNDVEYYTQQLGTDLNAPDGKRTEISFKLHTQISTIVEFESHWGTTSQYNSAEVSEFYIQNTDQLQVISVNATQNVADSSEETTPTETTPEETTAEETASEETTPEETTSEETTSPTEPAETVHIVAEGESLASIAKQYDTTYQQLATYNDIETPQVIQPGDEILIPVEDTQ